MQDVRRDILTRNIVEILIFHFTYSNQRLNNMFIEDETPRLSLVHSLFLFDKKTIMKRENKTIDNWILNLPNQEAIVIKWTKTSNVTIVITMSALNSMLCHKREIKS